MDVLERIKQVRKATVKTRKAFAERLDVAENYIYLVETGRNDVSDKLIRRICKEFNVDYDWLMYGGQEEVRYTGDADIEAMVEEMMVGCSDFAKNTMAKLAKMDKSYWKVFEDIIAELSEK